MMQPKLTLNILKQLASRRCSGPGRTSGFGFSNGFLFQQTVEVIDNISRLPGDDLKGSVRPGAKLRIAASSFSIYAFEALKQELESVEAVQFILTTPIFATQAVTDKVARSPREFHIPQAGTESGFYGTEFEIRLKNKLAQRAIARECADWIRRKAQFRSNTSGAPMQQFASVEATAGSAVYMPLHGFTAVDLGYQQGNAVSNFVNKMVEPVATSVDTLLASENRGGGCPLLEPG